MDINAYNKLMEPGSIPKDEQLLIMAELKKIVDEFLESKNSTDGHQLAIAGMMMRLTIGLYNGVLDKVEMSELFGYILEHIDEIPPVHPENRTIN